MNISCVPEARYLNKIAFTISQHAYDRAYEMGYGRKHLLYALQRPDEIGKPSRGYPDTHHWRKADLSLACNPCQCGRHLIAVTVLPRTTDAWMEAHILGRLGEGREFRDPIGLPCRGDLLIQGRWTPFPF